MKQFCLLIKTEFTSSGKLLAKQAKNAILGISCPFRLKFVIPKGFFILFFFIRASSILAQINGDTVKWSSLQLGIGINQLKEENINSLVHSGLIKGITFSHSLKSKNVSDLAFSFTLTRPKTVYEELPITANIHVSGDYRYLFKLTEKSKLLYGIGPAVGFQYNLGVYPRWDESHISWANHLDLSVDNSFFYYPSELRTLRIDLAFSVFSLFSRPEYNRKIKYDDFSVGGVVKSLHSNMESGSLNKSFRLKYKMEYQFHLTPKLTESICYTYNYLIIGGTNSMPFQNNIHEAGFKIYFK